ncbi:MAG: DUF4169 family protein [Alphaproteobacteria bacterium]|nr:DUF4169 family protein [Alphaproteobacteria bacterium]
MGEVINLRSFRKSKKRAEKEQQAAENRARSGRPKRKRKLEEHEAAATVAFLDAHRLDDKSDD